MLRPKLPATFTLSRSEEIGEERKGSGTVPKETPHTEVLKSVTLIWGVERVNRTRVSSFVSCPLPLRNPFLKHSLKAHSTNSNRREENEGDGKSKTGSYLSNQ